MEQRGLGGFFDSYLNRKSLFRNKAFLQSAHVPETVFHRDAEISAIAGILAPSLRSDKPSNLFVYGKAGSGKTLTVKHVARELRKQAEARNVALSILYLNCKLKKIADTEYRLIAQLARAFGRAIPPTGLPTEEVYKVFHSAVDSSGGVTILLLDEVDELVKKAGDEILYNLTRINDDLQSAKLSVVGISNDMVFLDALDPRVKSSLSEEELVFPPYNAVQLQDIISHRAKDAFADGVLEGGVIEKCAAYAAREHGDARRCLELLRVAGEIAERNNFDRVLIKHIDTADEKIERDRLMSILTSQPKQSQATLYSVVSISAKKQGLIFTGDVYELYKSVCGRIGIRPLTQRRISDIIAELDMLGIISVKVISKGRYGRTREIALSIPSASVPRMKRMLEEALSL
ncbi:ORC1-type DNA replication protein [Candidatus Woesearchaeota archaeon]|nr:ORC1-type DNA replication protein [Candidatus Woesearchaeota archaeon]